MLPLRLGSAEQFRSHERVFQVGFTEPAVWARLGLDRLRDLAGSSENTLQANPPARLGP